MLFSPEQRIFTLESYFAQKSYSRVIEEFRKKYLDAAVANNSMVTRLVHRFRRSGSVADKKRAGKLSILYDEKLREGETKFQRSPTKSTRNIAMECGISQSIMIKAAKKLHLQPYEVHKAQELKPPDYEK